MFWKINAWVDGTMMKKLAAKFLIEKQKKHGDEWVMLIRDNLSTHLTSEVKHIFGDAHMLVIYFPPNKKLLFVSICCYV